MNIHLLLCSIWCITSLPTCCAEAAPEDIFMEVTPQKERYSENDIVSLRCWGGPLGPWRWSVHSRGAAPQFVHTRGGFRPFREVNSGVWDSSLQLRVPKGETKITVICSMGDMAQGRTFTLQNQGSNRCEPGFYGNQCQPCTELPLEERESVAECRDNCPPGLFGLRCDQSCDRHCADRDCQRWTGSCKSGCLPGWTGRTCLTKIDHDDHDLPSPHNLDKYMPLALVPIIVFTAVLTLALNSLFRRKLGKGRKDFAPLPVPDPDKTQGESFEMESLYDIPRMPRARFSDWLKPRPPSLTRSLSTGSLTSMAAPLEWLPIPLRRGHSSGESYPYLSCQRVYTVCSSSGSRSACSSRCSWAFPESRSSMSSSLTSGSNHMQMKVWGNPGYVDVAGTSAEKGVYPRKVWVFWRDESVGFHQRSSGRLENESLMSHYVSESLVLPVRQMRRRRRICEIL